MSQRVNYLIKHGGVEAMIAVEGWLAKNFDPKLLSLIKVRASQINGCAYCLHMHRQEALAHGETEDRLLLLSAWQESNMYTQRERAALAWTESLTRIAETRAPDNVYEQARSEFSEEELISLSVAIGMINAWNRLSIGFRAEHPMDRKRSANSN